jgi:hypothetical protein
MRKQNNTYCQLSHKSEINREKELLIKFHLMNKFTAIGIPKFGIVAQNYLL